jgi:hypothetical protein
MTEIETLQKLNEIQSKIQKKAFVPKGDMPRKTFGEKFQNMFFSNFRIKFR